MTFNELLELVRCSLDSGPSVCIDSRIVKTGDIFVALEGTACDGHDFIDQAIAAGAGYIVCQTLDTATAVGAEVLIVDDSARSAGLLAQAAAGNPASKLTNLAVTGTNGKTTVAFLVQSVIANAGQKCGLVGTITYDCLSGSSEAALTTPDCLAVARMQRKMLEAGAEYMVIEASSHALSQNRLAGIEFKAAAFTNLSGDHLDYHKTEQQYLAAKAVLFEKLSPDATAVLNKESPHAHTIAPKTEADILWYGVDTTAEVAAHIESMNIEGTVFTLSYAGQTRKLKTPLPGRHNVSNHLAAAGLCLAAGFDLDAIADGLSALKTIPGRLEKVDAPNPQRPGPAVLVDYAHTDDALKNVLTTLRPLAKAGLTVVFGCGGDRDKTKRPRMAKVAEKSADTIIVTSDNPRTEEPADIINDIVAGFDKPDSANITVEPDRRKAIDVAVRDADADDIILIAGKGHETYQIIGREKIDFSDKVVALASLEMRR